MARLPARLGEMTDARRVAEAGVARLDRARRWVAMRRRWTGYPAEQRRAAFVVGCQRSGTSVLIEVLGMAPEVWAYSEGTNRVFVDYRLRETDRVERVVRGGPAPVTAMKPICDSHLTDVLLAQHPASRAIWIWRDYRAVARSGVQRWGSHQREVIAALRAGRTVGLGWRGERIGESALEALRAVPLESDSDGAVLLWWLRNSFLFELGLDADPRVRVLGYDALVRRPAAELAGVFGHLGLDVPDEAVAAIRPSSKAVPDLGGVSAPVTEMAEAMTARLQAATPAGVAADA